MPRRSNAANHAILQTILDQKGMGFNAAVDYYGKAAIVWLIRAELLEKSGERLYVTNDAIDILYAEN